MSSLLTCKVKQILDIPKKQIYIYLKKCIINDVTALRCSVYEIPQFSEMGCILSFFNTSSRKINFLNPFWRKFISREVRNNAFIRAV